MTAKHEKNGCLEGACHEGKAQYLQTAGGKITCLRCTAKSTRTKLQCGRPAIKTSRTQKCQYHGGRPHTAETLPKNQALLGRDSLQKFEQN